MLASRRQPIFLEDEKYWYLLRLNKKIAQAAVARP
jgi:hypothetical protein